MSVVSDQIDLQLSELPVLPRSAPLSLGWGTDLSCVTDVTERMSEVDPAKPTAVGQAVVRRYITPRGGLIDDANYGFDLRGYVNHGTTQETITQLSGQIRAEAVKDERVEDAVAELSFDTRMMSVALTLTLSDPAATPYEMVFFVTADGVQLIGSIDRNG